MYIHRFAPAILVAALAACPALAEEPGNVTGQGSVLRFSGTSEGKGVGFLGICSLEVDESLAATFGLYQAPGAKAQYTFLFLYKDDPASERGYGQGSKGPYEGDTQGKVVCDLELNTHPRGHELNFRLQLDRDAKTVTKDILTVGGKDYGPKDARVFLVDLTAKKPVLVPINVMPSAVPDFADEEAWGKQILAAKKELIEKSPEAKALFVDNKK